MKKIWFLALSTLGLISILIWFAIYSYSSDDLKVIACDVGQGDAFIITRKEFQILIDGGPNDKVLACLADNMPFWDRVVDVVILSHPQKDHFAGLIDVFENYDVKYFITSPFKSGSSEWRVLEEQVGGSGARVINPTAGQLYRFGLICLDILYPTEEFLVANFENYSFVGKEGVLGAYTSKKDPNEFSVVLIISYKDFDALFTGDIDPAISDYVAEEINRESFDGVEYVKVPHHGSKNGLSQSLLDAIKPRIAVIPVGKNNSYGHPHKEIVDMLQSTGVEILRTDEQGEIVVETNGDKYWNKN
ncbi:ComEC/Rec2 family competence protein [Patescibacteria group bacterium]